MDAAFTVVFAIFILAMIGLAFTAVRWAVRQDRTARAAHAVSPPGDPDAP